MNLWVLNPILTLWIQSLYFETHIYAWICQPYPLPNSFKPLFPTLILLTIISWYLPFLTSYYSLLILLSFGLVISNLPAGFSVFYLPYYSHQRSIFHQLHPFIKYFPRLALAQQWGAPVEKCSSSTHTEKLCKQFFRTFPRTRWAEHLHYLSQIFCN